MSCLLGMAGEVRHQGMHQRIGQEVLPEQASHESHASLQLLHVTVHLQALQQLRSIESLLLRRNASLIRNLHDMFPTSGGYAHTCALNDRGIHNFLPGLGRILSLTWSVLLGVPWGMTLTVCTLSLLYSAVARPCTALSTALCCPLGSPAARSWAHSCAYTVAQAAHLLARLIATANSCAAQDCVSCGSDWNGLQTRRCHLCSDAACKECDVQLHQSQDSICHWAYNSPA